MPSVLFPSLLKPHSGTGWKTAQLVQSSLKAQQGQEHGYGIYMCVCTWRCACICTHTQTCMFDMLLHSQVKTESLEEMPPLWVKGEISMLYLK